LYDGRCISSRNIGLEAGERNKAKVIFLRLGNLSFQEQEESEKLKSSGYILMPLIMINLKRKLKDF
jgi:pantothenate synthetase